MKLLVTGGNGFIGSWVMRRLLNRGASVRVIDLQERSALVQRILGNAADAIDWRIGDITKADDLGRATEDCDGVVHLASALGPVCDRDPVLGAQVNLGGTLALLSWCKRTGARFVYASTAGVFGPHSGSQPDPTTHYGVFKLATELCARVFWENDRLSSIGLRPLTVYGPGRFAGHSAGPTLACRAAARGEPYVIPFTGMTDFVYVDDVAAAFEAAIFSPIEGARAFNMQGIVADTRDFIAAIKRVEPDAQIDCEGPPVPIAASREGDQVDDHYPGLPRTDLHAGVAQTISYYQANDRWKPRPFA